MTEPSAGLGRFQAHRPGALRAFRDLSIRLFGIDQGDRAPVCLRRFVDQGEDPLRTRQAHDHCVDLVGHLAHVAGKLLGHGQKRDHDADADGQPGQAQVGRVPGDQQSAAQGHDDEQNIAQIDENGEQGVGVLVGTL